MRATTVDAWNQSAPSMSCTGAVTPEDRAERLAPDLRERAGDSSTGAGGATGEGTGAGCDSQAGAGATGRTGVGAATRGTGCVIGAVSGIIIGCARGSVRSDQSGISGIGANGWWLADAARWRGSGASAAWLDGTGSPEDEMRAVGGGTASCGDEVRAAGNGGGTASCDDEVQAAARHRRRRELRRRRPRCGRRDLRRRRRAAAAGPGRHGGSANSSSSLVLSDRALARRSSMRALTAVDSVFCHDRASANAGRHLRPAAAGRARPTSVRHLRDSDAPSPPRWAVQCRQRAPDHS
ncbi:MAG: hypothetical protein R2939_18630 [Kofleriaceae bacterium]